MQGGRKKKGLFISLFSCLFHAKKRLNEEKRPEKIPAMIISEEQKLPGRHLLMRIMMRMGMRERGENEFFGFCIDQSCTY